MTDTPTVDAVSDDTARVAALERRIVELEAHHAERAIRAELRAEAQRLGIVDLDGLKLIDAASLKLDENGDVQGVAPLVRELKRAKPWLFGAASTSSTAAPPPAQAPRAKTAKDMTYAEWQLARTEMLRRR